MSVDGLAQFLHATEEDIVERFLPPNTGLRIVRGS
jgi:hypothetical protein